jgi:hypothetical protein
VRAVANFRRIESVFGGWSGAVRSSSQRISREAPPMGSEDPSDEGKEALDDKNLFIPPTPAVGP